MQINNPPLYYFDESQGCSTQIFFKFNGKLYTCLDNGVGASGPPPGGTWQVFIHKSSDLGLTWNEITPAMPQVFVDTIDFQNFVVAGHILYVLYNPASNSNKVAWARFDLNTELWLADSTTFTGVAGVPIEQAVYRASNNQIVCAQHSNNDTFLYLSVYDIGTDAWTLQNHLATGVVDRFKPYAMCVDSVNTIHLICGQSALNLTVNYFHVAIHTDNTNVNPQALLAGGHIDPINGQGGRVDVGQLVAYLDVGTGQRMLGFLLVERDASTVTGNTTLTLWTAIEADVPAWTTVTVPTAEAADVRLANTFTSATAGPIAALLPVQLSASTKLYIVWTADGSQLAVHPPSPTAPWDNFMRWLTSSDGGATYSAITTDYQSLQTKLVAGPVYPLVLSQTGDAYTVGIFFPVIDEAVFGSINTKYSSLSLWFDSITSGGVAISISCNNPPGGTVGKAFTHTITAAGGTVPYSFAITAGALPTGLAIAAGTGIISGTPSLAGLFTFAVTVTDAAAATATIACSITIGLLPLESVSGGGTSTKCRMVQCHPKLQTACMGWGPLSITKDRTGTYAVYQDSRGAAQSWRIDPDADAVEQLMSGIARIENAPKHARNPGGLRMSFGQLDRSGSLVRFPDWDSGNRSLREAIMAALNPGKDEVL